VRAPAAALSAVALALVAGGAAARSTQAPPAVLLVPDDARVTITGATFAAGFPRSARLDAPGDVNGDGKADLIVLNVQGHAGDETHSFVVFGGALPAALGLDRLGARGVRVLRSVRGEHIAAGGDFNRDRRVDLIRCGPRIEILLGGRPLGAQRGDTISGASCGASAGDVDGDGAADLLVRFYTGPQSSQMRTAVVFGSSAKRRTLAVGRLRNRGFTIRSAIVPLVDAAPVDDVNGDGRADLVVRRGRPGRAILHVIFGRRRTGTLVLDDRRSSRVPVVLVKPQAERVASAGDFNGDGIGDLAVAERGVRVCIVFGRRGAWPAESGCSAERGVLIVRGLPQGHDLGFAVQSAGDVDGDGYDDLLVSTPGERRGDREASSTGAVYLVYGRKSVGRVSLATDDRVLKITGGPALREELGFQLGAPGDITADGRPDIVLGGFWSGQAWILSP
jgi:hypothetical protein